MLYGVQQYPWPLPTRCQEHYFFQVRQPKMHPYIAKWWLSREGQTALVEKHNSHNIHQDKSPSKLQMNVPHGCLTLLSAYAAPMSTEYLYVKFIKNNVLKLHSCFNLHFVAPNQVQNPSTEVIYKQKNQWWRSRTRKYTQFTFVMILVLKNVAGRVCVPLRAFSVYWHMYTQTGATAAQSRWLPSSLG